MANDMQPPSMSEQALKELASELQAEFPFLGNRIPRTMLESVMAMRTGRDPFLAYPAVPAPGFSGKIKDLGPPLVRYKGGNVIFGVMIHNISSLESFQFRLDDVIIAGAWKTGTTWLAEVARLLIDKDDNPFDPNRKSTHERVPTLDNIGLLDDLKAIPPPRLLKCPLHYPALPPSIFEAKPKILYIYRNPRDTCVSTYHFMRMVKQTSYTGSFDDFFELFLQGYVHTGPYLAHIKSFWNKRSTMNILFVAYEDLLRDFTKEVRGIAAFLGIEVTPQWLETMKSTLSFETMKDIPSMNHQWLEEAGMMHKDKGRFMRKGTVGDWQNHMTPEQVRRMDAWVEEEMAGTGIQFSYTL